MIKLMCVSEIVLGFAEELLIKVINLAHVFPNAQNHVEKNIVKKLAWWKW